MSDKDTPPSLEYASPAPSGRGFRIKPAETIVIIMIVVLLISIFLPSLSRWRDSRAGGDAACGRHLRQMGQVMLLYSMDHGGRQPTCVADLLCEDITPNIFVCPDCGDTVAKVGPTTQATAANVLAGGHLSYVIRWEALEIKQSSGDVVIAYEPMTNHQNAGTNVLYGDGHVDFVPAAEAKYMVDELAAGHNPPRGPTPRPAATQP